MKNRIEKRMELLKQNQEKAFITYITAGLPEMETCKKLIKVQEEAGTDVIELGIPFSDPTADGPVIQAVSHKAIQRGVNLRKVFAMVRELRAEGVEIPIIFMMYYNTALYYGLEEFVKSCMETGVDGLIIPDLPIEEQGELNEYLRDTDTPILIQLVSPISGRRIPEILKSARGFVYCVSTMGVTGQKEGFSKETVDYLTAVKEQSQIPVMMGFGIQDAADVAPVKEMIDGAIVGSHFITLLEESKYNIEKAKKYCHTFRQELNS